MIKLDLDTQDGKHFNHVLMTDNNQGFKKGEIVWVNFWCSTYGASLNRSFSKENLTNDILNHAQLLNGTWWGNGGKKLKILTLKTGSSEAIVVCKFSAQLYSKDLCSTIVGSRDRYVRKILTTWKFLGPSEG